LPMTDKDALLRYCERRTCSASQVTLRLGRYQP